MSRNRGGKTHRDERSDDEYDDEEVSRSAGKGATVNEWRNRGGKTQRYERSDDELRTRRKGEARGGVQR